MSARARGDRLDQFLPADRTGGDIRSRVGRAIVHNDRAGSPRARHAPGADAGCRCRPRSRAGAASRKPTAKIHIWSRGWASPPCAAFKGDRTFRDKTRVIATLKHFAAHGQPESGMNCAPVNVSLRVLRETFLRHSRSCIQEAGAISVMASYNEIDGVPSHANQWLLRDVLRKEWGFKGFVVSDYYAIWELNYRPDTHGHFVAADKTRSLCVIGESGR